MNELNLSQVLEYRWYVSNTSTQLLYKNKRIEDRKFKNQVWDVVLNLLQKKIKSQILWESSSLFTWTFIYLFCFLNAICRLICNINYLSTLGFFSSRLAATWGLSLLFIAGFLTARISVLNIVGIYEIGQIEYLHVHRNLHVHRCTQM